MKRVEKRREQNCLKTSHAPMSFILGTQETYRPTCSLLATMETGSMKSTVKGDKKTSLGLNSRKEVQFCLLISQTSLKGP